MTMKLGERTDVDKWLGLGTAKGHVTHECSDSVGKEKMIVDCVDDQEKHIADSHT